MKFSAREDINAPIDEVFAAVTDFQKFERQILNRGATLTRHPDSDPGLGTSWDVSFVFRGRQRAMKARVAALESPNLLVLDLRSDGLSGDFRVELLPLSAQKTRMSAAIELSASTLTARLLLQSLKLAKANLTNRFKKRVADFALGLESRGKPQGGR